MLLLGVTDAAVELNDLQICNDGWYHGYQEIGVQYTCIDSNTEGYMLLGGSMANGCQEFDATSPNDYCAILSYQNTDGKYDEYLIGKILYENYQVPIVGVK